MSTIDTGEDTIGREIAAWDENPEQRFSREELNRILTSAVDGLTPIYRSVFVLRDIDGFRRKRRPKRWTSRYQL